MKSILIVSIFLVFHLKSGIALAQGGNLQFNQVLTYQGELNGVQLLSPSYVVPSGKVWKIECLTETKYNVSNTVAFLGPLINGVHLILSSNNHPIWLKSGDTLQYKGGYFSNNGSEDPAYKALRSYFVSIIEYNIVP